MRPDKVTRMLFSMADAGSVGLDSMPRVETVVAPLAVQADEALRSEQRCPQPEYKRTDTLVRKTLEASQIRWHSCCWHSTLNMSICFSTR